MTGQEIFLMIAMIGLAATYLYDYKKRRKITSLMFTIFILSGAAFRLFKFKIGNTTIQTILISLWLFFGIFIIFKLMVNKKSENNENKKQ